jgi:hypothetical protein
MYIVKTRPWREIAEFYRSLADKNSFFEPMARLNHQIAASNYASGLYAWTSMHTLCITQTPEPDLDKEVLRIHRDVRDGNLVLDFQETGSRLPKYQHWIRRFSPDEGFSRFELFLGLKKWFVEYKSASS